MTGNVSSLRFFPWADVTIDSPSPGTRGDVSISKGVDRVLGVHGVVMPWRMKVTLRTLTTIETTVQSCAEYDRLRNAIEADAARSFLRRPFRTWVIAGQPRDIMFRLADVLTVVNEPVEA